MITLDYNRGEPPHIGYYLVRCGETYRLNQERDFYPYPMYWNGKEWQSESNEDAINEPWAKKPFTFPLKMYPEWVEVAK